MTNLEALRAIAALAASRGPLDRVDADLSSEAGMDGVLAHLLQAARDLDTPKPTTSVYTFDCTLYATVNIVAASQEEALNLLADTFTDAVIDLVVAEGDPNVDDAGRVILRDCDLHADPAEAPRLRAMTSNGPNNL
jgi:hypothetical protein